MVLCGFDVCQTIADASGLSRNEVKETLHAKMYKQSNYALSVLLGCTLLSVGGFHVCLNCHLGEIYQYIEEREIDLGRNRLAVTGVDKKVYTLPFTRSSNAELREIRRGLSFEIQGTLAELINLVFRDVQLNEGLKELNSRIVLSVFDSLLIESSVENRDKVISLVKGRMEGIPLQHGFPQYVSYKSGDSWYSVT